MCQNPHLGFWLDVTILHIPQGLHTYFCFKIQYQNSSVQYYLIRPCQNIPGVYKCILSESPGLSILLPLGIVPSICHWHSSSLTAQLDALKTLWDTSWFRDPGIHRKCECIFLTTSMKSSISGLIYFIWKFTHYVSVVKNGISVFVLNVLNICPYSMADVVKHRLVEILERMNNRLIWMFMCTF